MDKPTKGHSMKIKLHPDNQEEMNNKEAEAPIGPFTRVIKINKNHHDLDGLNETAATQEPVDESFDWIIPESSEHDIIDYKSTSNKSSKKKEPAKIISFISNSKKKNDRPFGSILISAIFAILIGTTIGVVMLKLVISPANDKMASNPATNEQAGGSGGKNPAVAKTTSTVVRQLTTFVIQGGYYLSKDGASTVKNQLTAKGIPSQLIEMNGKYYIFLGVADSLETAKSLSGQYKENGADGAFAKSLSLEEKKLSGITEIEKSFLEELPKIYQTLTLVTSSSLVSQSIPEESTKALESLNTKLKVSGIKNEKVKTLKEELSSVKGNISAYQKSQDLKSLTEAQQHLLNFLSFYYSM